MIVDQNTPATGIESERINPPTVKIEISPQDEPIEIEPPPPSQNPPPTEEQQDWMRNNPRYSRMSHGLNQVGWSSRGTLRADGTFIEESRMPVHDGNGDFGVGIPIGKYGF